MGLHSAHSGGGVQADPKAPRIAVIGAGVAGLTCARELCLHGFDPVVFEADDRVGGRCSSRATRVGWFDDGAQCITGFTRLPSYAEQRPGELAAVHPWTVPVRAAEIEGEGNVPGEDDDQTATGRMLATMGAVGVPSMFALVSAVARPIDVRLKTPILHARRHGGRWTLRGAAGDIDEDFQALVLALPAPLALPLVPPSSSLIAALRAVQFRGRWVLLLGSERHVGLPSYREFQGSPIERIAAMHSKPGRPTNLPQRWFVEADEFWSTQHEHDDAETVAELLLDNFRAHAGRSVTPVYLRAHRWRHAFSNTSSDPKGMRKCLWDFEHQIGVCGDSVVCSRVDSVHASGSSMARLLAAVLGSHRTDQIMRARQREHALHA